MHNYPFSAISAGEFVVTQTAMTEETSMKPHLCKNLAQVLTVSPFPIPCTQ